MSDFEPACPRPASAAIVGIGSPHGDDQLGWIAVDLLRGRLPPDVLAVKVAGGPGLLDALDGQDRVTIVDAAAPAGRPGTIRSFAWPPGGLDLEEGAGWSSHGLGVPEALRLAEALGRLPRVVTIATVEAERVAPGLPLSESTSRGLAALVESLVRR